MLYPKEDRLNNTLMFACRTCQFSEPAASSCVFRNNLYNTVGETAGVTQDVGSDPTVGLPDFCTCTLCGDELLCFVCGEAACTGFVGFALAANDEDYEENIMEDPSEDETSEESQNDGECVEVEVDVEDESDVEHEEPTITLTSIPVHSS